MLSDGDDRLIKCCWGGSGRGLWISDTPWNPSCREDDIKVPGSVSTCQTVSFFRWADWDTAAVRQTPCTLFTYSNIVKTRVGILDLRLSWVQTKILKRYSMFDYIVCVCVQSNANSVQLTLTALGSGRVRFVFSWVKCGCTPILTRRKIGQCTRLPRLTPYLTM